MQRLREELGKHEGEYLGTLLVGDLNVHNRRWLRYSSGETAEGTALEEACSDFGLLEKVRAPIRGENLLDFVLQTWLTLAVR